ncbi:ABC transporter substrate-binding protein [uncultured Acetatifactor sp.]|jgi:multiple sugar transport system substrate-binding protein/putative aldouronate transport system substrate-binding protein|uniref:ABC transporter substrate-binding protein n=1 Tax=uncultured Acetatifactor sp. TaxID=1671927 RepID=UPI00262A3704|nr:ABC transporter substrate-binding protein [uncultured Acetatifactor sp.]
MKWKKAVALSLAAMMALGAAGCGDKEAGGAQSSQETPGESGSEEQEPAGGEASGSEDADPGDSEAGAPEGGAPEGGYAADDLIQIEVYDVAANYHGIQSGWYAKMMAEKFGLELSILAPQVSGDGAGLYQTRVSNGNLGDVILLDNADFIECVEAGLVKDITGSIYNYENLAVFKDQIDAWNGQVGDGSKVYGIPSEMTNTSADTYSESIPFSSVCLPWDYYKELGSPEIKNLDELLDVLEQMQQNHPTNKDGDSAYAISLWKDWDGFGMENILQTCKWYGQEGRDSVLLGNDNTMMSIIDENGAYYKLLNFFFEANQRGLIDPDSSTQDWATTDNQKLRNYRKFLLWYNWEMSLASINLTDEDRAAGKGFVNVPISDMNIYQVADSYYGSGRVWGVGSQVEGEKEKRIMDMLDWMASAEGVATMWYGIEGINYVMEDGRFVQPEDATAYMNGEKELPAEWGGGSFNDGTQKLNQYIVGSMAINPRTNEPYSFGYWSSQQEKPKEQRWVEWAEKYGTDNQTQYYQDNGLMKVVANVNVVLESDTTDIALVRSQCGQELKDASWRMIMAKDKAEFDQMWTEMKDKMNGLGFEELYEFDCQKYQKVIDVRKGN